MDANTRLADAAAATGAQAIGGLGIHAVCVYEPQVTPPSTTILVLLDGSRVYRATAAYEYCDTIEHSLGRRSTGSPADYHCISESVRSPTTQVIFYIPARPAAG